LIAAPVAAAHCETEIWFRSDIAFTSICFGIGERSSKRSLGKVCSAYH
jgi:hypothetical protein